MHAGLVAAFIVCRSSELDRPTTEAISRKLCASPRTVGVDDDVSSTMDGKSRAGVHH